MHVDNHRDQGTTVVLRSCLWGVENVFFELPFMTAAPHRGGRNMWFIRGFGIGMWVNQLLASLQTQNKTGVALVVRVGNTPIVSASALGLGALLFYTAPWRGS